MGMGFGSDAKKMGRPFFYRNKIVSKSREQLSKKINPQPQACKLQLKATMDTSLSI